MESLVAVVVTFNRLGKLKNTVAALVEQSCEAIVVVDNCSTDGTREWLAETAERYTHLDVVLARENRGGAGGFELGVSHALETYEADWLVLFDDDAYPKPGAFEGFLNSDLTGIDSAAAAVRFPDGRICEMNRPSENPFWHWRRFLKTALGGRGGFHVDDASYDATQPVAIDCSSFVGFFVRRGMVKRVGLPDGRLFIYADDIIYTLRITAAGGKHRFLPWVEFTHDCSVYSDEDKVYRPLWKVYYAYRNGMQLYRVSAGRFMFCLVAPVKALQWLFKTHSYGGNRIPYLRLLGVAIRDFVKGNYGRSHAEVMRLADQGGGK